MSTGKRGTPVEQIDIGDGIVVPATMGTTGWYEGFTVELTARYDAGSGRYVAQDLAVHADAGCEITGTGIRQIKVSELVRLATEGAVAHYLQRFPHELAKDGPTTEMLRQVAYIYRLALLLGDAPTGTVASTLDVPRSTAGRWVTRARDRGYLTVTDPRGTRAE